MFVVYSAAGVPCYWTSDEAEADYRSYCVGGYYHVFPGVLFTLDEARNECRERGFNVVAVGDIWQCAE